MKRILTTLAAILLALGMTTTLAPNAGAQESRYVARTVSINGAEPKPNTFRLYGKVDPCGRYKWTHLQYRRYQSNSWRTIRHMKTNGNAQYSYGNVTNLGYYRVAVFRTNQCGAAYSGTIRIYRL